MKKVLHRSSLLESFNPATLEKVGEVAVTPLREVENVVQYAQRACPEWYHSGLQNRISIVENTKQLLLDRSEEFAQLITVEMGRPYVESFVVELEASIDLIGYCIKMAKKMYRTRRLSLNNIFFRRRSSYLHFEPLGVVGVISPWNWPLLIPLGCIVPALLAGNAVVFKHSELTPLLSVKIHDLFRDAGVSEGVFRIIQGGSRVGKALVCSNVKKIFFTGSSEVGQKVMRQAAETLKGIVLELGGNDPAIVCADADLDFASSGVVWGGFSNCGQNCNAIERVYIDKQISDRFIDLVIEKLKKLRVGNGIELMSDIGPMASKEQLNKMEKIVSSAIKRGATVLTGGSRIKTLPGYFFEPTVLLWDQSDSQPNNEEVFGPIIHMVLVENDEEAVRLANQSTFGLAASVWTSNRERGKQIAEQLEVGTVMINDVIVSFGIPEASWTGIKQSGVGWVHGEKGFDEMVNIKYINYESQCHTQKFWWFPYTESMVDAMRKGMQLLYSKDIWKRMGGLFSAVRRFSSYLLLNRKRRDKI